MRESMCVRVPFRFAEDALRMLSASKCLRTELMIKRSGEGLVIPVKDGCDLAGALDGIPYERCRDLFSERMIRRTFKDLLKGEVPEEVLAKIPSSIDLIGDIAVIKLPNEAMPYAKLIGESVTKIVRNVKSVYASGPVTGEFRIRALKHVYGLRKSKTVMKEYGIRIVVDVLTTYVNPSLSEEHRRIASMIGDGEVVADLFSGVGPFTLHILALRRGVKVYAVDKNPEAIKCLIESLRLNKHLIRGSATLVIGDVEEFGSLVRDEAFSRIIMNLPLRAYEYIPEMVRLVRVGGIIHAYVIASGSDEALSKVLERVSDRQVLKPLGISRVIDYAPRKYIFRVDLRRAW